MWIRTQNKKKLVPVCNGGFYPEAMARGVLLTNVNSSECIEAAKYESEKRSLEVLDEIQSLITGVTNHEYVVYQMPEV